jgi:hypothetical protein
MSGAGGIFAAAREVQDTLAQAGFRFCFIGGLALQRWGEPRYTQDVDLSLLCPFGEEITVARRLQGLLEPRIPDAVEFSGRSRVFLGRTSNGTPVDIAFAGIDFERRCLDRASAFDSGGVTLTTCGAEDLVVMKVFAGRDQDWVDVRAILTRRGDALDFGLVERELLPLLRIKGDELALERLRAMRAKRA